jgi:hypothetical protein
MSQLTALWPLPLGFLAGALGVGIFMRWLLLLLAAIGKLPRHLGTPSQRPRQVGIRSAIIHPVPWLLVAALVFGIPAIAASPARLEWIWFVAGIVSAPVLNGVLVYRALRRSRAGRRGANPP